MQCLNASSESNIWWFYSSIRYAEWHPLASPPEVCQSFKDVLSTLRSVGDAHWARAVASALGVCLAGIRPEGKVRYHKTVNKAEYSRHDWNRRVHQISDLDATNIVQQNALKISDSHTNEVEINNQYRLGCQQYKPLFFHVPVINSTANKWPITHNTIFGVVLNMQQWKVNQHQQESELMLMRRTTASV